MEILYFLTSSSFILQLWLLYRSLFEKHHKHLKMSFNDLKLKSLKMFYCWCFLTFTWVKLKSWLLKKLFSHFGIVTITFLLFFFYNCPLTFCLLFFSTLFLPCFLLYLFLFFCPSSFAYFPSSAHTMLCLMCWLCCWPCNNLPLGDNEDLPQLNLKAWQSLKALHKEPRPKTMIFSSC